MKRQLNSMITLFSILVTFLNNATAMDTPKQRLKVEQRFQIPTPQIPKPQLASPHELRQKDHQQIVKTLMDATALTIDPLIQKREQRISPNRIEGVQKLEIKEISKEIKERQEIAKEKLEELAQREETLRIAHEKNRMEIQQELKKEKGEEHLETQVVSEKLPLSKNIIKLVRSCAVKSTQDRVEQIELMQSVFDEIDPAAGAQFNKEIVTKFCVNLDQERVINVSEREAGSSAESVIDDVEVENQEEISTSTTTTM